MHRLPALIAIFALLVTCGLLFLRKDALWPALNQSVLHIDVQNEEDRTLVKQYSYITNQGGRILPAKTNPPSGSPLLIAGVSQELNIAGHPNISAYLAPAFSERQSVFRGLTAAFCGLCLAGFLLINSKAFAPFGLILSLAGAFATIPLGFSCLSCSSPSTESFIPLGAYPPS